MGGFGLTLMNNFFNKVSDWISWLITTWGNFLFWVVAVAAWFLVFAIDKSLASAHFMPAWFTSTAFNFPLNTVTTLVELYIGFLVGRNTNRTTQQLDRHLDDMQGHLHRMEAMLSELTNESNVGSTK